jgi:hypothetical protein
LFFVKELPLAFLKVDFMCLRIIQWVAQGAMVHLPAPRYWNMPPGSTAWVSWSLD